MRFQWDENKAQINIKKHQIKFETATMVFKDHNRLEFFDELHSLPGEERYITIGLVKSTAFVVVTVVYTERGEFIRIISARKANKNEREMYYAYSKRY